jgi:hypothetical protein
MDISFVLQPNLFRFTLEGKTSGMVVLCTILVNGYCPLEVFMRQFIVLLVQVNIASVKVPFRIVATDTFNRLVEVLYCILEVLVVIVCESSVIVE